MLNSLIQKQNFELIGDAIGRVLTAEFANQVNLGCTVNPTIFKDRGDNFDVSEGDCINVVYAESQLDFEHTSITDDYDNKYIIEIYCSGKTTSTKSGTQIAAERVAKIGGIVRTILKSQDYAYLDFEDKFIQHVKVQSIVRTQPREGMDSENIATGIVEVHYTAEETVELKFGETVGTLETNVKISDTEKGYQFIIEN